METDSTSSRPHAVCVPYPAQGHISPMLKLAKILHHKGFRITFVNTEYNHKRLLNSSGVDSLNGVPTFQFKTIPDGLPPCADDAGANSIQNIKALSSSLQTSCLVPFRSLVRGINQDSTSSKVSCIVSDGFMTFTLEVAQELGIPEVLLCTTGVCAFAAYMQFPQLIRRGLVPIQDETKENLETRIDGMLGLREMRLKDLPCSARTTNKGSKIDFIIGEIQKAYEARAIVFNTFDILEQEIIASISSELPKPLPPIYTLGSLHLLQREVSENGLKSIGSSLWKEEPHCLEWLDSKQPNSVVYVNFGSVTVMTAVQLIEFAWGLANSGHPFLWIVRPGIVSGNSAILPHEFITETQGRGYLASWCSQEEVLGHRSIGGFLTHCGWNSTIESVCSGVPMICWPFFSDQTINCRYICKNWGIGLEIDNDVKRDEVESLVRELMAGEKHQEMKMKVMELKILAEQAIAPGGSSYMNLDKMINQVLLSSPSYRPIE